MVTSEVLDVVVDNVSELLQLKLVISCKVASAPALFGTVAKPSRLGLAVESNPVKFRLKTVVEDAPLGARGAEVLATEMSFPKSMLLLLVQ
jgi:hypothetical protein